ncbi:hypothetical protein OE88DRAFT_1662634 [Heliocybe sulcata]|uniref:Uncharacterized protein n=1 Tax=Heliocybe sulcata TaxID=5364 RepID=A0A5C3MW24_9AGAM|nr:hypothetical protein OE88DRAFT_1662634 [Heliocybe sulcata]
MDTVSSTISMIEVYKLSLSKVSGRPSASALAFSSHQGSSRVCKMTGSSPFLPAHGQLIVNLSSAERLGAT